MSDKMGRPILDSAERKDRLLQIRLTASDFDRLDSSAERLSLSRSDAVRRAISLLEMDANKK